MLAHDIRFDHDRADERASNNAARPANDAAYRMRLVPAGDPLRSSTKSRVRRRDGVPEPAPILYEEFHPYGSSAYRAVDSSIGVSAKRYRYTGKERDEETGLDHMGARYYAPWLGRWTAADPIGLGGGINRYEYVRGNPVRMSDPSGMAPPQDPSTLEGAAARRYIELVSASIEGPVQEFDVEPIQGDVLSRIGYIAPDSESGQVGILAEAHAGRARSPDESHLLHILDRVPNERALSTESHVALLRRFSPKIWRGDPGCDPRLA